jgi:hypothetical protein
MVLESSSRLRIEQRLSCTRHAAKRLHLVAQFAGIFPIDHELIFTEFHHTETYDPVPAVDDEIDLCTAILRIHWRMTPRRRFRPHSGNPKRLLDCGALLETQILKGIPTPAPAL